MLITQIEKNSPINFILNTNLSFNFSVANFRTEVAPQRHQGEIQNYLQLIIKSRQIFCIIFLSECFKLVMKPIKYVNLSKPRSKSVCTLF